MKELEVSYSMSSEELDMETEDLYSSDEEHKRAGRRIEERRFK